MKTSAAVLWQQPGKWEVEEVELEDIGPTEVLVEMAASGLCHSDDHFTTGDQPVPLPFLGGHEGSGIVRAVGAEVRDLADGDHVITSFIPACGKCKWCALGLQNLCDNGALLLQGTRPVAGGYKVHARGQDVGAMCALGTFAQWQTYDQMSLVKIDPAIPLDSACLVACGVQTGFGSATRAAAVRAGDVVLVLGAGGVGMNAVQGAALSGARHVVVVDPAPFKRQQATTFGATEAYASFDDADAFVKSVTNGQGADSAIVTIGVVRNEHIGQAYQAVRKAGTVVVTGIGPLVDDTPVPGFNAFNVAMMQKQIKGALYGDASPREAMPQLLQLYVDGRLKLDQLITRRYTLEEINQGYADMHAGLNIRGIIDYRKK
jgi:S-(hydroxymethyl)glutathione dehydrogenase/alcohol dehydrogenase